MGKCRDGGRIKKQVEPVNITCHKHRRLVLVAIHPGGNYCTDDVCQSSPCCGGKLPEWVTEEPKKPAKVTSKNVVPDDVRAGLS